MKELGAEMGISATMLGIFERGERAIPLPALETAVRALDVPLREYHDQTGMVGQWFQQQQAVNQFMELSPELQSFVAKPVNIAYLELAMRLSGMSVDKLRAVAEGLLDITI
jgi:transcriptional regulator with XRE-family HTH domain